MEIGTVWWNGVAAIFIKEKKASKTSSADANTSWYFSHSMSSTRQAVSVATVFPQELNVQMTQLAYDSQLGLNHTNQELRS